MEFYPWVVVGHVILVILAFGAHGVSAFGMFKVKRETDRQRMIGVLELSTTALLWAGIGLVLAVLFGIAAAWMGGHFGRLWPWVSIAVVVIVWIAMTPMAAGPMNAVRQALGLPSRLDAKGTTPSPRSDVELTAAQARLRPELVAAVGVGAIMLLVWLMEQKPF
jgi:hypothetical protein